MKLAIDFLTTLILRGFFYILRICPPKIQNLLALGLTKSIIAFYPRSKYVCFRNLSLALPHTSEPEKERIWKGTIKTLSNNMVGFARGPGYSKIDAERLLDTSDCKQVIEDLKNNTGKGVLLLVPHFGQFELLAMLWCIYDRPFAILARGFGMKYLDHWWNKQRTSHGNIVFGRKGGFKDVLKYLENGTNVGILFDQNVKASHSIFVDFFGIPASTTKTIGLASLKTTCKILFTSMVEMPDGTFKLIAHWIKPPQEREGDHDKKIHDTIADAHKHLEDLIRKYPEQWFWIHRRFKTRPLGEAEDLYDTKKHLERL